MEELKHYTLTELELSLIRDALYHYTATEEDEATVYQLIYMFKKQ